MNPNDTGEAGVSVFKVATVWAAVGVTSWAEFASMLAAIYTLILIGEWCWKKFIRKWFFGASKE